MAGIPFCPIKAIFISFKIDWSVYQNKLVLSSFVHQNHLTTFLFSANIYGYEINLII
jgi:hypothetical protein